MLAAMAWRNLSRNPRRSILTGAAVVFGVVLCSWMKGLNDGAYAQLVDRAVRTGLGHVQVLPRGYADDPDPERVIARGDAVAARLRRIPHVTGVSRRARADAILTRDSETAPVEILGVEPVPEASVSRVPGDVMRGSSAVGWCRREMGRALDLLGGDRRLFDRWCRASGEGSFLPVDNSRGIVLGSGVARTLLVSVGDELTVQVARAVGEPGQEGREAGSLSQRRLVVTGIVHTGGAEIDDRFAYVHLGTLTAMLGTSGPNEIVAVLDDIRHLDRARSAAVDAFSRERSVEVSAWDERNPALASLMRIDTNNNNVVYFILCLLISLGVVNATLMSVLERTKEFGVVLALGARPAPVFGLVMTEVAMLGALSIGVGGLLAGSLELFGRIHGWPLEWLGAGDYQGIDVAGVTYESVYYSMLTPTAAAVILGGAYVMFLLAGLFPAIRASRLRPVEAMRTR